MLISRSTPFSCEQMYAVVADVERYPEFLPAWHSVEVLDRDARRLRARQCVRLAGFDLSFESLATQHAPDRLHVSAEPAAFSRLEFDWRFRPGAAGGCTIELQIDAALRNRLLEAAALPVLATQQTQLLDYFVAEAERRYGPNSPQTTPAAPMA